MNTTTAPKTLVMGRTGLSTRLTRRSAFDWLFALLVVLGTAYAFQRYRGSMDGYEQAILIATVPALVALSVPVFGAAIVDPSGPFKSDHYRY